jgi:hypothetical protein
MHEKRKTSRQQQLVLSTEVQESRISANTKVATGYHIPGVTYAAGNRQHTVYPEISSVNSSVVYIEI